MIQTFTPDDVLKSQTGELPESESAQIHAAVQEDPELQAFLEEAEYLEAEMPKLLVEPSEKPLQNIMAFVKKQMG